MILVHMDLRKKNTLHIEKIRICHACTHVHQKKKTWQFEGKEGLFYGIDVTQGKGLNDGRYAGINSLRFVSSTLEFEIIQRSNFFFFCAFAIH